MKDLAMILAPITVPAYATRSSRALIVGLALIPLTLVVIASIPALVIMPFTPDGWLRCQAYISRIATWSAEILAHSSEVA